MKITMYELLRMIKDGKAPKKIKFNNIYCYYRECKNEYVDYTNKPIIQWDYVVMNSLNEEVEILEEEPRDIEVCGSFFTKSEYDKLAQGKEEKKIPEKLEGIDSLFKIEQDLDLKGFLAWQKANNKIIENKINEIISYLDYLKRKGE